MNEGGLGTVVVTRAETADGPLSSELRTLGLQVLLWPAVSVSAADPEPLRSAIAQIQDFAWIVFASRHAVVAVTELMPRAPAGLRIAAVGQATAQVLRQRGWRVDLLPDEANAAALVGAFAQSDAGASAFAGTRVLYPASSRALPTLAAGLRALGAQVTQVEAYRTESAALDVAQCRSRIEQGGIAAVTFASPSAVIELEQALGTRHFDRLLSASTAIAIGPTTARELADRGRPAVLAESPSLHSLALTTWRVIAQRGQTCRSP